MLKKIALLLLSVSPMIHNQMVAYGGAPHGFTVFESERYREKADKDSWACSPGFSKPN